MQLNNLQENHPYSLSRDFFTNLSFLNLINYYYLYAYLFFLLSMINHFKIPIISIKSGIPWMRRNPVQKSFVVLVGEAVAIIPINKANGVAITFNPKLIITNDNFSLLIFGNPADQNKIIATNKIKTPQTPKTAKTAKTSTS